MMKEETIREFMANETTRDVVYKRVKEIAMKIEDETFEDLLALRAYADWLVIACNNKEV